MVYKKSYRAATAYKKILPRRCRDAMAYKLAAAAAAAMVVKKNVPNFTSAPVLDQKYWY
jgi:hypothetical protein